ncbi:hypothetical protein [Allorhizocola rhizosphaerae]|uniref:hypothetical protein n=1 Tax=Allorhizocola rhizosphaerae TaxID=1872709 RepID=UPI000E3DCCA5|nr:hypothetical protein [Allorhizocola rhizosphaerae]
MRRLLAVIIAAVTLAATGCAQTPAATRGSSPAGDWPAGIKEAEVYVAVLRRYVTAPQENSLPANTFKVVYVLDTAHPGTADPMATAGAGVPIPPETQARVASTLKDLNVKFIADRDSVLDRGDGCAQVKDGGVLITLGPVDGDDNEAKVGINGYIACLGATWLTYVVRNEGGAGWAVTGTTGPMAIA